MLQSCSLAKVQMKVLHIVLISVNLGESFQVINILVCVCDHVHEAIAQKHRYHCLEAGLDVTLAGKAKGVKASPF